ncbi:family 1 glycosylhydrolase [Shigella flexneri]
MFASRKSSFESLQDKVKYWMTFNEINNQRNWRAPLSATAAPAWFTPSMKTLKKPCTRCCTTSSSASALAVKAARRINPEMKVGCMLAMVALYPFSCKPEDVMCRPGVDRERYVFTTCSCAATTRAMW